MTKDVAHLRKIADEVQKHFCVPYAQDIDDAADEIERLRAALRGLTDMYCRTWDRVDGALVMMPDNIERFEKAHAAAQAALGDTHEPGDVTRLPVPGTKLTRLSDIADELIRELHKQGMEKMQAVFDGTRLRIDPWPEPASRESPSATIVTAEEASHPASFRHWRKDEQVPYDGCHCRTCVPARASVKPSPADLVGALQDVVHTDPGPVRAGHASREASSLPEHVHSWDGDQCHYCHIPRSAVIDDASNLCPATSPPVPHQAAQPGMRFDIKPGTCIYCGITLKSGEQHGGG